MVFAAASAMWLYCTGTVGGRGRLLSTEKVAEREVERAKRNSEKHWEEKESRLQLRKKKRKKR